MIVNRLEVFGLDPIPEDILILFGATRHISDKILDKDRIVIRPLSDEFFIRTLEQAIEFGTRRILHQTDHFLDPHRLGAPDGEGDMAALVMRPRFADRLGAGTERRDRNDDRYDEIDLAISLPRKPAGQCGIEPNRVVEQSDGLGDGGCLFQKIGKLKVNMGLITLQRLGKLHQNIADIADMEDRPVRVQYLDESAHVRPLEMMRKINRHLNRGDCSLLAVIFIPDTDRITQILHPDAINRKLPVIRKILRVGKVIEIVVVHEMKGRD